MAQVNYSKQPYPDPAGLFLGIQLQTLLRFKRLADELMISPEQLLDEYEELSPGSKLQGWRKQFGFLAEVLENAAQT